VAAANDIINGVLMNLRRNGGGVKMKMAAAAP
jgi:hypothetical protein